MAKNDRNLFQQLTRLFRSGPVVKRKIRSLDTTIGLPDKTKSSGTLLFQKSSSPTFVSATGHAYNTSERLMRYQDFCFTGDTLVALSANKSCRLDELVNRWEDGLRDISVLSYDANKKAVVSAAITGAKRTGHKKVIVVVLSDGTQVKCTPDHRFMLSDGSYAHAVELKIGASLMTCAASGVGPPSSSCLNVISIVDLNTSADVYDIEVKGYSNFALAKKDVKLGSQGLVIVHNCEMEWTPEIAAALDIFADETCLSGDTIIPLLDGEKATIKSLFDANRENFWLYSYDIKNNKVVSGLGKKVIKTGTKQLFKVKFDETFIKLTDNHRVLLSNGEYAYVRDLRPGDSIRSLYTTISKKDLGDRLEGYEKTTRLVVSIEPDAVEEVFDLEVETWHNFASITSPESDSYVFVHNCASDDKGRILHVYSDNEKIREILEDLFYNTLNTEFNLRAWIRNLCKYGDCVLINDVSPQHGVVNVIPVPINEIEREENFDPSDPLAVRYRWVTLGNRVLENWEVTHFRLLGNDMFLPYGSSVIEPARRIWRQLILAEDAMLVYRVVRAPDRRVFYADVANIPPENVPAYVEELKKNLRSSQVVDQTTSRVDLRYNVMPVHKDTPVPLLDGTTLTIEAISKRMKEDPSWTPWVYSVQDDTKDVVPGKVVWCGRNYTAKKLIKVWLDDDSYVMTAPEHPFILSDGSTKRADELSFGDSLMSAYRDLNSRGYERVTDPNGLRESTHVLVAKNVYKQEWDTTESRVVHHKKPELGDLNKRNNSPENLKIMNFWEHRKMHAENCMLTMNRPEQLDVKRKKRIAFNKSLEQRLNTSRRNKLICSGQKMGKKYNGTKLHFSHNEIRRQAQIKSWHSNYDKRCEARRWIIPNELMDFVFNQIKTNPKINREELTQQIRQNSSVIEKLLQSNFNSKKDASKFHVSSVISKLMSMGLLVRHSYKDFVDYALENNSPVNHQVVKIDTVFEEADVYCMTVVGAQNEDDRHNFAVNGLSTHGVVFDSLIFVRNSIEEDYIIPVRGGETGTKIENLAGGQNAAAIEDVAYLQKKLFAALKIPRAYLGYDESIGSKSTLAQEDIRFSRTINVIQKTIISELNKLAIIHLYACGYDNEDLQNFTLRLTNPSTIAQQQKLELWRTKFEIAGSAPEGQMSKDFIRREIWGLNDEQCRSIDESRLQEKMVDQAIESAQVEPEEEAPAGEEPEMPEASVEGGEEEPGEETGGGEEELFAADDIDEKEPESELLTSGDDAGADDEIPVKLSISGTEVPVKAQKQLKRALYNRSRIRHSGAAKTHIPEYDKMLSHRHESFSDPFGSTWMKSFTRNPMGESYAKTVVTSDIVRSLKKFRDAHEQAAPATSSHSPRVLNESPDDDFDYKNDYVIDSDDD